MFRRELRGVDLTDEDAVIAAWDKTSEETSAPLRAGVGPSIRSAYIAGWARQMEVVPASQLRRASRESALLNPPTGSSRNPLVNGVKLDDTFFGRPDKEATQFMETRSSSLVSGISDTTRNQLRSVLASARQDGLSSEQTAKMLAASFPQFATASSIGHVENRAHLIAVTEMADAYGAGTQEAVERLAALGAAFKKEWLAVGGGKTCPLCARNEDAGELDIDAVFPASQTIRAPAHPACRCTVAYRPVSMAELGSRIEDYAAGQAPVAVPPPPPDIVSQAASAYRPARFRGTSQVADYPEKMESWKTRTGKTGLPDQGDVNHGYINAMQGFDGYPTVVDSVDDLVANGWEETWRGVSNPFGQTGPSFATQFREGEFFPGYGIYGNGTYTAFERRVGRLGGIDFDADDASYYPTGRYVAEEYSDVASRGGEIMRIAVNPNARFIDSDLLGQQVQDLRTRVLNGKATPAEIRAYEAVGYDEGRMATVLGYDGIIVKERGFLVVLNRTILAVERKNHAS